jgi:hypothetical protein
VPFALMRLLFAGRWRRADQRSTPSVNASSAPVTSRRSTPTSSAKWLRVPAGTHANGIPVQVLVAEWYSATTSMRPTMLALSSVMSSAGIQYSVMVRPPAWWVS